MNTIIVDSKKDVSNYWNDLWRFRELFLFLSWRDILVRYKQTVIGILWAIVRPVLTMIIFTFVFGRLAKLPSGGIPYPVLVYSAMLPWQFFASALAEGSNSLVLNGSMLSKIFFPRLIIPASSVIVCFIDFLISATILVGLMIWFDVVPTWRLLTLPFFTALCFLAAFGASLWLSALNVKYRDFRYILPFVIQIGVYLSPVGFSSEIVKKEFGSTAYCFYSINPMVGIIEGFRWAVGGPKASTIDVQILAIACLVVAIVLVSGYHYFRATEETFADII